MTDYRPPSLSLENVGVRYGALRAVSDASLAVEPGEIMALVGPSGCGKSTLLASINRMTEMTPACRVSGRILLDGQPVDRMPVRQLRQRVGMVFQKPNPFPLSIEDNLRFPLREHGVRDRKRQGTILEQVLTEVGLWEEVRDRLGASALGLSGGQQQRLCLARALALNPEVLLLDEPCSALDPIASRVVEEHILGLRGRYTVLLVTHNLAQARRVADHMAVFWHENGSGRIIESGPVERVFEAATHPVAAAYCRGETG